ncbi:molybdopterin-guanine dinucleotide biosynthesis protein B [Desulfococcus sp.]|uniref:molybdopterin-guanine dinucleotide biosynthesis protein B n=1 Tax=Desulfococcus sp. TaxID=2025834 RepID=UPI00359428D1
MPGPMTGGKPLPPMISFVGHSGSGKTTLLVKLIPELKRRGYRIGTVKHTHHEPETHDRGKDSTRHREAGAETVIFASSRRISLDKETPGDDPEALLPYFHDMDLVITEGFKRKNRPKIEVYRTTTHAGPLYRGQADFVAMVTDADLPLEIRKFHLEDITGLADFIEKRFLADAPRPQDAGRSPSAAPKESP